MARDLSPRIGRIRTTVAGGEQVRAYVPPPLPPEPPLDLAPLLSRIEAANQALGRLDGITAILPAPPLFIYMYLRKEALLSSQIEGTQSSLSDLLLFEHDELPLVALDDVQEVSNYVAAIDHGLMRLRGGFPLSLRLIREIHEIFAVEGQGGQQRTGRVPADAELDWWDTTGKCSVCSAASRGSDAVPERFRTIPPCTRCTSSVNSGGASACTV